MHTGKLICSHGRREDLEHTLKVHFTRKVVVLLGLIAQQCESAVAIGVRDNRVSGHVGVRAIMYFWTQCGACTHGTGTGLPTAP